MSARDVIAQRMQFYAWWHRIRGHHVLTGFNVINPIVTAYHCEKCQITWQVYG